MLTTETIHPLLDAIILLLLLYLVFVKSYFQEKGKNLATKEDTKEITSLVESVKTELQFSLQTKLSLRTEEHQALVEYFSKYTVWLGAITSWSPININSDNTSRLAEIRSQLDMLHQDFDFAAGKLMLFVENNEILSQHYPLAIQTLKLQFHANQASFDIERVHLETKQTVLSTHQDKQAEEYQKLLEKEKNIYQKHKEEQFKMYEALFPLIQGQQRAISKHIRVLANG